MHSSQFRLGPEPLRPAVLYSSNVRLLFHHHPSHSQHTVYSWPPAHNQIFVSLSLNATSSTFEIGVLKTCHIGCDYLKCAPNTPFSLNSLHISQYQGKSSTNIDEVLFLYSRSHKVVT
jgi:hypothetical protein